GPVFYYSLLGPAGALAYRVINTLDSMVGYKDDYYRHIGWMSARLDTAANYMPARLTAALMVVSARMLGADWKNSLQMPYQTNWRSAFAFSSCSFQRSTSIHWEKACRTSGSSISGFWPKPSPFSTAQRLATWYWPSTSPPKY
ncbi:MAG: hypothetical protein C4345_13125, partial [Chloroflexota bacterium]